VDFTEKTFRVVSCGFVDVGIQDLGIRGAEGIEGFSHHFITKKVQSLEFRVQSCSEFF
jgi:hypothetical protein